MRILRIFPTLPRKSTHSHNFHTSFYSFLNLELSHIGQLQKHLGGVFMAKRKIKRTRPTRDAYMKERRRIQRTIKRLEKRGFFLTKEILRPIPKKVTKQSVAALKKIDINKIYKATQFVDFETGEILTAYQGRLKEKRAAQAKRLETIKKKLTAKSSIKKQHWDNFEDYSQGWDFFARTVISNFRTMMTRFNDRAQHFMSAFLDKLIRENGEDAVAQMLEDAANAGYAWKYEYAYDDTLRNQYISDLLHFLPDQGDFYTDQVMQAVMEDEGWGEFA